MEQILNEAIKTNNYNGMKTIRVLFLVSFLIPLVSFAQEDIKNQIISFTDSTEIMIRNGRRLVVDQTVKGDSQRAIETINFLKKTVDKDYVIFYPAEELLLALANSNFEQFLYIAGNFDNFLEGKTKYVQTENITVQIHEFLAQELSLIKKDLERSTLNTEDKELAQLYIRYYESEDKFKLNKSIKSFKKTYPDSKYNNFLKLIEGNIMSGEMNFCLGYGHEFLNGNIANAFTSHFQNMNMEFEWFIDRMYYSIFMQGSVGSIHSSSNIPIMGFDIINTPDDDVFSLKYGVKLGRTWITNRSINFFSYISIGGYQMKSEKSNFDIPSDESANLKLTNAFNPGIGTACDIYLKHFKSKVSGDNIGQWFIRPNVGYDFFVTSKKPGKGGSLFLNLSMGIGFGN